MKKSKRPVTPVSVDGSLEQMRSALIAEGFMLPTRAEELSDDELSLYGQGNPQSLASLERKTETGASGHNTSTANDIVQQSMAMAARNGQQISKDVWSRMRTDRLCAEDQSKHND